MDAIDGRISRSLRKLLSCARPPGKVPSDISANELGERCKANIPDWVDELQGADVSALLAAHRRARYRPFKQRARRGLDGGHIELHEPIVAGLEERDQREIEEEGDEEPSADNAHVAGEIRESGEYADASREVREGLPSMSLRDQIRHAIARYLGEERLDERHTELKTILREVHHSLSGGNPLVAHGDDAEDDGNAENAGNADNAQIAVNAGNAEDDDDDAGALARARSNIRESLAPLYAEVWDASHPPPGEWDPATWSGGDIQDIKDSLDRRSRIRNAGAIHEKGWPSLKRKSSQVSPACSHYTTLEECIWPCAWKSGKIDRKKQCRPARKS